MFFCMFVIDSENRFKSSFLIGGVVGQMFGPILGFLALGRSESCRRFPDLQKSVVILSKRAVWTRNVAFVIKALLPK